MKTMSDCAKAAVLALAMLAAGTVAASAEPAGTAVNAAPQSEVTGGSQPRILEIGSDLFIGDLVRTSASGRVEIVFADETQLVIGPGSTLEIADYLLRNDGSAGNLAVKALAGTFRFVTGNSDQDRYRIITPTGTIGVRGTAFDLVVDAEGSRVIMYRGATELCGTDGSCAVVSNKCELGTLSSSGASASGLTNSLSRDERKALRKQFVYGSSQQPLSQDFRLRETAECLRPAFTRNVPGKPDGAGPSPIAAAQQAAPVPGAAPPSPVAAPPRPAPTPSSDSGGDCAGNSSKNPGKSQNCSK